MRTEKHELVVVGAGPAGLTSGIAAASYGVETLVIDRRSSTSSLPRSTVASTGTMELLRRWGLEAEIRKRSLEVIWRAWACSGLQPPARASQSRSAFRTPIRQHWSARPRPPACRRTSSSRCWRTTSDLIRAQPSTGASSCVALTRDPEGGYLLTLADPVGTFDGFAPAS